MAQQGVNTNPLPYGSLIPTTSGGNASGSWGGYGISFSPASNVNIAWQGTTSAATYNSASGILSNTQVQ